MNTIQLTGLPLRFGAEQLDAALDRAAATDWRNAPPGARQAYDAANAHRSEELEARASSRAFAKLGSSTSPEQLSRRIDRLSAGMGVWNSKTYGELTGGERAELKRTNPELFATMRAKWCAAEGLPLELDRRIHAGGRELKVPSITSPTAPVGKAYEAMTGAERAQLKASAPEAFTAIRNDWIARGEPSA